MNRDPNEWREDAACRDQASAYFDPWHPDSELRSAYNDAKYICRGCPVRAECLTDAMRTEGNARASSRHGMFGGLSPKQRAALAKAMAS